MGATVDLKTFLDWYKQVEITLGDTKRVFREPAIKDLGLSIEEMLIKYCLEWKPEEFLVKLNDLPKSKYKECLDNILQELGLV